jgi:hypothetical protein
MAIENRHIGIVGQSGSGKFELLNHIISQYPFVIIFDNEEEYNEYKTFHNLQSLHVLIREHNANPRNKFIVRYVPLNKMDEIIQLNSLCSLIWTNRKAIQKGTCPLKLVIPEIAEYAIPKTYTKWLPLRTLIKRGRKFGIHICWDTQKLSDCDNIIWGQTRFIYIFKCWGNDEKYLTEKTGIRELPKYIRELGDYEFLKYDTKDRKLTIHNKLEIE